MSGQAVLFDPKGGLWPVATLPKSGVITSQVWLMLGLARVNFALST